MSLIVYPYIRNVTTGKMDGIDEQPDEQFNDLFGFEIWRKTVWSSTCLKELNCQLLNSLIHQDIYAEQDQILLLQKELELVKDNISNIAKELKLDVKSFGFRIENALEAIRIAQKQVNGGVYIG